MNVLWSIVSILLAYTYFVMSSDVYTTDLVHKPDLETTVNNLVTSVAQMKLEIDWLLLNLQKERSCDCTINDTISTTDTTSEILNLTSHDCTMNDTTSTTDTTSEILNLSTNATQIEANLTGYIILFTGEHKPSLNKMDLQTGNADKIYIIEGGEPFAVDYIPELERIIWSDQKRHQIRSILFNGSDERVLKQLYSDANVVGMAVDTASRLIFYSDSYDGVIALTTYDGKANKKIIKNGIEMPGDVVLDSTNGIFYWTDNGAFAYIAKANYDGSDRKGIITSGLSWCHGLAADFTGNRLYWADSMKSIGSAKLDGSDRKILLHDRTTFFSDLVLFKDHIYFTNAAKQGIMRMRTDGSNLTDIGPSNVTPHDLQIMSTETDQGTQLSNACTADKGGCVDLCFPKPGGLKMCACSDGRVLKDDGYSCQIDRLHIIGK